MTSTVLRAKGKSTVTRFALASCLLLSIACSANSQTPQVKRILLFQGGSVFEYDPRAGIDKVVNGPKSIESRLRGLKPPFTSGIDAAVNWGDGNLYLFKGAQYWKYDILLDRATTADPVAIAVGWTDFPADFKAGIDAAFNAGEGK